MAISWNDDLERLLRVKHLPLLDPVGATRLDLIRLKLAAGQGDAEAAAELDELVTLQRAEARRKPLRCTCGGGRPGDCRSGGCHPGCPVC